MKPYRWMMGKLEDPAWLRSFAGWNVVFWIAIMPVAEFTGWINSVKYVSYLSEIALVLSSLSWWQSSRVEVKQDTNGDGVPDEHAIKAVAVDEDDAGRRISGST